MLCCFVSYGTTEMVLKKMYEGFVFVMKGYCNIAVVFLVGMSKAFPKTGDVVGKVW